MVDFFEPIEQAVIAIQELSLKIFVLKANLQFVEILPTTYIFQSRSIYNIPSKVVRSIKKLYDQYIMICKYVATFRCQPTLISLSIQIKVEE